MKTYNLTLPTTWNQLNAKQVLYVWRLFGSTLDHDTIRQLIFQKLTGIRPVWYRIVLKWLGKKAKDKNIFVFKKGKQRFQLTPEEMHYFLTKIDFLFTTNDLTDQKFPVIRAGVRKLYGPSAKCFNITFREFIYASRHNFQFSTDRDTTSLNKLCSVLYRRHAWRLFSKQNKSSLDARIPFNDFTYVRAARRFRFVSMPVRMFIYTFFNASTDAMMKKYTNVFSNTGISSAPKNPVPGLIDSVKLLAGFDPTNDDKILDMLAWQAFDYLDTIIKNQPKQK